MNKRHLISSISLNVLQIAVMVYGMYITDNIAYAVVFCICIGITSAAMYNKINSYKDLQSPKA